MLPVEDFPLTPYQQVQQDPATTGKLGFEKSIEEKAGKLATRVITNCATSRLKSAAFGILVLPVLAPLLSIVCLVASVVFLEKAIREKDTKHLKNAGILFLAVPATPLFIMVNALSLGQFFHYLACNDGVGKEAIREQQANAESANALKQARLEEQQSIQSNQLQTHHPIIAFN